MLIEPLVIRCEKQTDAAEEDDIDAVPMRRETSKNTPSQKDTDSLLEEDNDVSFTSERISQIYKPYTRQDSMPRSPQRTSAPLAMSDDV